ncbi:MAG TPA: CpaD family pilus assembly protein [Hyphomicrobiaceae bacterium]|nr:CpaD family pilus assembly protein [Hyphomicrobiaceae bacterium]
MNFATSKPALPATKAMLHKILAASLAALPLAACKHTEGQGQVAGWTLVDPAQRHPILVSQQPQTMTIRVAKGSKGLAPQQRAELLAFADHSRASDAGNSRLVISAPGGADNEVASMHAVHQIRRLLSDNGFSEASIAVEAYDADRDPEPPIRVSYLRYVAEGPRCGAWPTNLAHEPGNLPYPNLGCATQRNFAAMVANPADLLGPRTESDRASERRDVVWEKYIKGESTISQKNEDERVQVQTTK